MNKPRKPLRGLFSKTEAPETPATKPQPKVETAAPKMAAAKQEAVKVAAKKPEVKVPPAKPIAKVLPKVEVQPELVREAVVPQAAPKIDSPVAHQPRAQSVEARSETGQRIADAISKVNYNFEMHKSDREEWQADQYVDFIKRIDTAQTEAFFLKGKLLEEAKRRFFENNKVGWAQFCETSLLMNYTTTNQYIRVSQEFDVTSHQRPDFGFEHFKALLPLAPNERLELMESLPTISVKQLRNMVQERLAKTTPTKDSTSPIVQARGVLKLLQQLKSEILRCDPELLMQEQRWQLSAASRNLAEELTHLSNALNPATFGSVRQPRRAEAARTE